MVVEKDLYRNSDIDYIQNMRITEYDMKTAGFNIIKELKLLSDEQINQLEELSKSDRNIAIGKLMKNNAEFSKNLTEGFKTFRQKFCKMNHIEDADVLAVKKDAIFLLRKIPEHLQVGKYIQFVPKHTYTSYAYINGIECYYDGFNNVLHTKNLKLDFDSEVLYSRGEIMDQDLNDFKIIRDIKNIMRLAETKTKGELFSYLQKYRDNYLRKKLPIETYREVSSGLFSIVGQDNKTKFLGEEGKEIVDISDNFMAILLPFFQILL